MLAQLTFRAVNACSWILSVLWFITGAIYLDYINSENERERFKVAINLVVILAVWTSIFQLISTTLFMKHLKNKWRTWCYLHMYFFLFSIPPAITALKNSSDGSKTQAFAGFTTIQLLFTFLSTLLICYLGDSTVDDTDYEM